jgi:hypothetical protein
VGNTCGWFQRSASQQQRSYGGIGLFQRSALQQRAIMAKVSPTGDPIFDFCVDDLPSEPKYHLKGDFPLWAKYTKGKLGGKMDPASKKRFVARTTFQQEKLFPPHKSPTDRQFVDDFRKSAADGMKSTTCIMNCIGCCAFPSTTKTIVINANVSIVERQCTLKPSYTYNNHALKLIISKPRGSCCGLRSKKALLPTLICVPPVGLDGNHAGWSFF